MFYKKALEKIGVDVQVIRHGKFKGAVEPFILDEMSKENREQIKDYVGSIWNHVVSGISTARNIPVDQVNKMADNQRKREPQMLPMLSGISLLTVFYTAMNLSIHLNL